MGNTSKNGMIGETAVLNRLVQLGYEVLLPWSQDLGYDLAYYVETEEGHFGFFTHKESQLVRVQCKLAWLSKDGSCILFNTSTASFGGPDVWKKKRSGYMVSVWEAPDAGRMILRLSPTKNNQSKGVKWAKDYEV